MPQPEHLVERRTIFEAEGLAVFLDHVRLPDGRETHRHVVDHPGSVVLVPIDGGEVVLVHQYRHAAGRMLLELPAGTCDHGEPVADTAARELAEETGLAAEKMTHLGRLFASPGYSSEAMDVFLAESLSPAEAEPDEDESLELVRLPWTEAVRRARHGEFEDMKTVAALLLAEAALTSPR